MTRWHRDDIGNTDQSTWPLWPHGHERGLDVATTIKPLEDRVLVQPLEAEQTTASGLVIPDTAKEKPQVAVVLAVGPGGVVEGKEITMHVKEGQKVIYSKYAGTEIKLDGEEVIVVRQNDILGIVED